MTSKLRNDDVVLSIEEDTVKQHRHSSKNERNYSKYKYKGNL